MNATEAFKLADNVLNKKLLKSSNNMQVLQILHNEIEQAAKNGNFSTSVTIKKIKHSQCAIVNALRNEDFKVSYKNDWICEQFGGGEYVVYYISWDQI